MKRNQSDKPGFRRRDFFASFADGLHGTALAWLLGLDLFSGTPASAAGGEAGRVFDLKPRPPHFPATAKAVIHLFMNGGPSQVDLFDPKPLLKKYHGKPIPREFIPGARNAQASGSPAFASP